MEVARIIRDEEPPKPSTRISSLFTPLAQSDGRGGGGESLPASSNNTQSKSSLTSLAKARSLAPESYAKQLRGELDWIVMKSMEKDRKRRYSSPEDLAQDIDRHLEGTPIEAAPPDLQYRTQKFIKKHKTALVGASIVVSLLLLALAGTSIGLVQARQSLVREQIATAKETKAREDAEYQSYIANIGAAQVAMDGENWPEARERLERCPEPFRGWEWNLLNNEASRILFGISRDVFESDLSPDGKRILTGGQYSCKLWDLATGRLIGRPMSRLPSRDAKIKIQPRWSLRNRAIG